MENNYRSYGLVTPPIYASHYFAGILPKDILQLDGDWTNFLPTYESQAVNFELTLAVCSERLMLLKS